MDELIKSISELRSLQEELRLRISFQLDTVNERLERLEEQIDGVYYLKGKTLATDSDNREAIQQMVAEEYEVMSYVFYKENEGKVSNENKSTAIIARRVLFSLLQKHTNLSMFQLKDLYGYHANNCNGKLKQLFEERPLEKKIYDDLDRKVESYVRSLRPI
jgi:hypothetical protein